MWDLGYPPRHRRGQQNWEFEQHDDLLHDLSPGTRVSVWFDSSGFIQAQYEGRKRDYAIFLIKEKVVRIRVKAIQAIVIL